MIVMFKQQAGPDGWMIEVSCDEAVRILPPLTA